MVDGSFRVLQSSATTKTGRHDITELLLKVALSTNKINQIKIQQGGYLFLLTSQTV
jgi:hypothetical protein